jgi:NAD(P)-dependent dehydrogenase (short-subunit alcohol dehydrogenase family)
MANNDMRGIFELSGKVVVITGGAGLLGKRYAQAAGSFGAKVVLLDIRKDLAERAAAEIQASTGADCIGLEVDITKEAAVAQACSHVLKRFGSVYALINNAAVDPKVTAESEVTNATRLEDFSLTAWNQELAVGLTGAFLCAKHFGPAIIKGGGGTIINISSDLGLIGPDQRLYRVTGLPADRQPVKPVTYSVIKTGIIGLTRYLSTYWAGQGVRCNALCPGGVLNGQSQDFVKKVSALIPLGRMADQDEYMGAIVFLLSRASSYMNGTVLSVDGGRTAW